MMDLFTLRDSIDGITDEIVHRSHILYHMRGWLAGEADSAGKYTAQYIYQNGPRIEREIKRLKLIKIELIYLFGLMENS